MDKLILLIAFALMPALGASTETLTFGAGSFTQPKDYVLREAAALTAAAEPEHDSTAYAKRYTLMLEAAAKAKRTLTADDKKKIVEVPEPTEDATKQYRSERRALEEKIRNRTAELDQVAAEGLNAKIAADRDQIRNDAWAENKKKSRAAANDVFNDLLQGMVNNPIDDKSNYKYGNPNSSPPGHR